MLVSRAVFFLCFHWQRGFLVLLHSYALNALNVMKRSVSPLKYEFFCYIIERGILTFEIFPHLKNLLTIVIWNICLNTFMRLKEGHWNLFFCHSHSHIVIVTVIMILSMFIFYYCLKQQDKHCTHWSKLTLIPFLILRTFDHSSRWEMIKEF